MSILHDIVRSGRDIAKTTRERYLRDLNVWIEFAGTDPIAWTRQRAQDFYDHLIDVRKLKPQSANRLMTSVQYASRWWAYRQSKPELDFALVQKAPGQDFLDKHAIAEDDARALIRVCQQPDPASMRDLAIIVVGLETGMRRMSLISMTIEQTFFVPHAEFSYPVALVAMKGSNNDRIPVPLSDTAIHSMLGWIAWLRARGITRGPMFRGIDHQMRPAGTNGTGLVAVASKNQLSEPAIGKMLVRRSAEAKIGHVHPHMFRHTFVTWRANAGLAPHEIAAVTAHTISGLGALAGYIDMRAIAEKIRNSTPQWLRELVMHGV